MADGIVDVAAIPYGVNNVFAGENKYAPRKIYNPLTKDFTFTFGGEPYVLKAGKVSELPDFLAVFAAPKLAERILDAKHPVKDKRTPQLAYGKDEIQDQIHYVLTAVGDEPATEKEVVVAPKEVDPNKIDPADSRIEDFKIS